MFHINSSQFDGFVGSYIGKDVTFGVPDIDLDKYDFQDLGPSPGIGKIIVNRYSSVKLRLPEEMQHLPCINSIEELKIQCDLRGWRLKN